MRGAAETLALIPSTALGGASLPLTLFFLIFFLFFLSPSVKAYVYVYEVVTKDTTFQTASKLPPDAFLMYNGGEDVIFKLTVLKVYADNEFDKALEDYGLQSKNVRFLPHDTNAGSTDNRTRVPFYWWR
jgi:hypothetical protein